MTTTYWHFRGGTRPFTLPLATRGQTGCYCQCHVQGAGGRGRGRARVDTLAIQISFIITIALHEGCLACLPRLSLLRSLKSHPPSPTIPPAPLLLICTLNISLIMNIRFISSRCWFSTSIFALKLRHWEGNRSRPVSDNELALGLATLATGATRTGIASNQPLVFGISRGYDKQLLLRLLLELEFLYQLLLPLPFLVELVSSNRPSCPLICLSICSDLVNKDF